MHATSRVKRKSFHRKVNSRSFCWCPAPILVDQNCPSIWHLHTMLYKGAWNVWANNSVTLGHKDLRFGQIVYILVFYNISFSWHFPLDGFQFVFFFCAQFIAWRWKRRIMLIKLFLCFLTSIYFIIIPIKKKGVFLNSKQGQPQPPILPKARVLSNSHNCLWKVIPINNHSKTVKKKCSK